MSLKIVSRYDSEKVLHDSKDYSDFNGKVWNDFVLFCLSKKANLLRVNLSGADLSEADLSGSDLSRANLSGADLSRADLSRVNLSGADLSEADLSGANLSRANLSGADLSRANLSIFCKWNVSYYINSEKQIIVRIGCKEKTIKKWDKWFKSDEEFSTKRDTVDFKRIKANYKAVKAYIKEMGDNLYVF